MRRGKSKQEIIEKAGAYFFTIPFSKLTANEIALRVGVSKRTFYKNFYSKENFLDALIDKFLEETIERINIIKNTEEDVLKRMAGIMAAIQRRSVLLAPPFLEDMQKNNQAAWKKIDDFRTKHASGNLKSFMEEGIKNGKFRNFDPAIVSRAFLGAMRAVVNPQVLVDLSVSSDDAIKTVFEIFIKGIKK